MRRISANYIFPVSQSPLKNGIIEVDDSGVVLDIINTQGQLTETRNLEFYNGVIVPGFINAHCHLELSELKGKLNKGLTIPGFINQMIGYKRNINYESAIAAAKLHDGWMRQNGIVAVADIVNNPLTISIKQESQIFYLNLIELIGLGSNASEIFSQNILVYKEFLKSKLTASIVPHAPYSVSENLFGLLSQFAAENNSILSVHNQESESENEMFRAKKGKLIDLFKVLGFDLSEWKSTGKNSIDFLIEQFPKENNILFVHNLYSTKQEVSRIANEFSNSYFVLCPKSNYYIENKYPELDNFLPFSEKVTIGTDSLASNNSLSILEEMKVLTKLNAGLSFEILISWATLNGAKALKLDDKLGSIEIGKNPGINLVSDFDFVKMQITDKSIVSVLV